MGVGLKEILLILLVVLLVFGTGRLKGIGTDLGEAIRGFRRGMKEPGKDPDGNPSA